MVKPKALVDNQKCLSCGGCISVCPKDAITMYSSKAYVSKKICTDCGICIQICPVGAIRSEVY